MEFRNCNFAILFLTLLCGYSEGQLNFNLPSIFSRLSKTSQASDLASIPEPEIPVVTVPAPVSTTFNCAENETHFELITGKSFKKLDFVLKSYNFN